MQVERTFCHAFASVAFDRSLPWKELGSGEESLDQHPHGSLLPLLPVVDSEIMIFAWLIAPPGRLH